MLRRIAGSDRTTLVRLWGAASSPPAGVAKAVSGILSDVERRGDAALLDWTEKLDGVRLTRDRLRVGEREIRLARKALDDALLEALREASFRIERFAARTLPRSFETGHGTGVITGTRVDALESAGLYVPGGKASYPSSVLMNALPARVAGVPRRVMTTPPGPRGKLPPLVLAAAHESGVHEIYRLGGAQAIAALVFGTATVKPVVAVTGPGNAYVAEAKRQLMGSVAMDSIAGPSELVVLADDSADGGVIALRLLAQDEHDESTRVAVVSDSERVLREVERALEARLARASRRAILRESLPRGLSVLAPGAAQAIETANLLAPEHLEIHTRDPRSSLERIRGAGAVFLGARTPTALGDYGIGPNHTLPTGRTARFASALSAANFVRVTSIIETEPGGRPDFAGPAALLARAEGLVAHAQSLEELDS